MDSARLGRYFLLLVAVAVFYSPVAGYAADNDQELRQKVLALNEVTGDDTIRGYILSLTEDKDNAAKVLKTAMQLVKDKQQPFNYNAAYILARTAQELKDIEAAKTFYKICFEHAEKLASAQKLAQSAAIIDFLYTNKKYADAEKMCSQFLEIQSVDPRMFALKSVVQRRMIMAIAKQGKGDQALRMADSYIKARRDHWLAHELKGWVQREIGQTAEAAKTYENVLKRILEDKALRDAERAEYAENCRYILSGIYVDLNQIDKSTEHLEAILKLKPNDPTYNNDLGYIWADNDMHLDKAEKLIRKAIEEDRKRRKANPDLKPEDDRDNSAYLDSLGWVLFKKKKYKEALIELLKAVQHEDGKHVEIFDHLGQVYLKLGNKKEAIEAWKQGIKYAGDSKREQERKQLLEKRIKELLD
ncbi:MAG: hypothetical protein KatS3mg105_2107 [Gemmatales bacterium]|nr:MAG: hypothetical protein KatS3mg105_2107 [Gemmatales bacterium]